MEDVVPDARRLLGLPVEMNVKVLSFALLNSSKDVLNLIMSCKAMYDIFENHKTSIFLVLLSRIDLREVAIATAHYHATAAPWRCTKDLDGAPQDYNDYLCKITDFCEQHLSKQGTELRIPFQDFTLPMVAHINDIHFTIHRIATTLAPRIIYSTTIWPAPSPIETAKIVKALYIIDLVRLLFFETQDKPRQHAFTKFSSYFAPLESEQVEIITKVIIEELMFSPTNEAIRHYLHAN